MDHLSTIENDIDTPLVNYEIFFLIRNLNVEGYNSFLKEFCDGWNLKNLIKDPTCVKNPVFPTNTDVM